MLFNSWVFAVFFCFIYVVYLRLNQKNQNIWLTLASYLFYGAWDWRFLSLILISTFVDYTLALIIHEESEQARSKRLLFVSILINLGILGIFKYFDFFISSAYGFIRLFGFEGSSFWQLDLILPVGISFYTFQTMGYTIDVYRKKISPLRDYLDYSLFVAFFPQLVAGPIERASHLIPQITSERKITRDNIKEGMFLLTRGFFKKVFLANNLGVFVDNIFAKGVPVNGLECLLGVYAFTFQIYGDFSGYSDMARGLSKLLGFDLVINFNRPYLSPNPREFWKRWHISLSRWFRDYLYIPLGGSEKTKLFTLRNLLITMVIGGLWHGASFNFIFWGVFHGLILILHRLISVRKAPETKFSILKIMGMFHLNCLGWLIFRSENLSQVFGFLKNIFLSWTLTTETTSILSNVIFFLGIFGLIQFFLENKRNEDFKKMGHAYLMGLVPFLWILVYLFAPAQGRPFLYFQF